MLNGPHTALSPVQAVDRLEAMHADAVQAQRDALTCFVTMGVPPSAEERGRLLKVPLAKPME